MKIRLTGPSSATLPAYMISVRSHVSAITERSWVIRISDSPSSRRSRSSSSRIWAWTMTSRAVVGSSPMTIAGSQARAIAIIARWRIPPDSSCGYAPARLRGMPTSSSSSPARFFARSFGSPRRISIGSAICSPTRWTGLSAFIAPWKTMLISRQRYRRSWSSVLGTRSMPNSLMLLPLRMRAFGGRSRTSDSAVVVLPQPDSPASPSASPSLRRKLTPSTALTQPDSSLKCVRRSFTTRSGAAGIGLLRERPLAPPADGGQVRRVAETGRPGRALGRQRLLGEDRGLAGDLRIVCGGDVVGVQVAGQAQLLARIGHRRVADFGLRMSSRAFPTSVNARTTSTTQTAGGAMYHHAPRPGAPVLCAESSSWPHDGENGSPRPMNDRLVSVKTAAAKVMHRLGDDQVHDVREDVPPHDVPVAGADDPRPVDEHARSGSTGSASG